MPSWRRDGKELFYLAPNNTLMAVSVALGSKIEAGAPAALFETTPPGSRAYDVTANGQQFLVATAVTRAQSTPFTVVINWTAELRR
jgi:eukaryotic-like serine/threonine-protein kinase